MNLGVIHALREFYGLQPTPPDDPFQFFVWEILSRGSLPARRDLAWLALKRIPALTPDALFRAPPKVLLDAVGISGPYREEKVERLRATIGEFKRHRPLLDGDVLRQVGLRRAARTLRMVSRVDADSRQRALLFSAHYPVLTVDEEVSRVVARLMGLAGSLVRSGQAVPAREGNRTRRAARRWLAQRLAQEVSVYQDAVVYLRHHAQHTCLPSRPHCAVCPLAADCPSRSRPLLPSSLV